MAIAFYFYDLETSGFSPREARVMQFAGQRTDLELNPVGEPHNYLLRLTEEVLPDPDAVLVTGITPQQTLSDGISEAEFLELFQAEIALPGTVFVGFNTVRFDDEFMRFMLYRNFHDPYEWQWQDDKSRWDLLDLIRLTRALRPDGIKWPVDAKGNATNRLELLTSLNGLAHENAHDALSDVQASIALARLVRNKQLKLFQYLFEMRDKKKISELVNSNQPFVYASGKFDVKYEKTTVVASVGPHPEREGSCLVFDLRHDPKEFVGLDPTELATAWRRRRDEEGVKLPVKLMQFNRCPAVAPLGVLDDTSQERLELNMETITANYDSLLKVRKDLLDSLHKAMALMDTQQQSRMLENTQDVDGRLYDSFLERSDKTKMQAVRAAKQELATFEPDFKDDRLKQLLPLYKARNYPQILTTEERKAWEEFRRQRLIGGGQSSRLAKYFARLQELATSPGISSENQYLLEELQLYGQSIAPDVD